MSKTKIRVIKDKDFGGNDTEFLILEREGLCKVSELISLLEEAKRGRGDKCVMVYDTDTDVAVEFLMYSLIMELICGKNMEKIISLMIGFILLHNFREDELFRELGCSEEEYEEYEEIME